MISKKIDRKEKTNSVFARDFNFGGVDLNQRVLFAKNISMMIKSGLPIAEALGISADAAQGSFKKIILKILSSVEAGGSFSDGLRQFPKVFSPLFVNAVYAGEASGTLEENLAYVAEQLRKEKELSAKIKGAMLYPIVVLLATFFLGLGITFFVLPKITPLFEGLRLALPPTTRALIWFSRFVEQHGLAMFAGIIAFVFSFGWFAKQRFSHPATHWILLNLPIIRSLVRNSNIASFCRTLGTLIKSGLTIGEAVAIGAETADNYYYARAIGEISRRMESGSKLAENMLAYETLFPKFMISMIRVGEESGRLEETLLYLASYFEEEVDEDTKNLSTAIEPALLIGIGLVVGFLAISIITPIYSITGNINK